MSYLYSTDYTDCTDVVESNNMIEINKAYYSTSVTQSLWSSGRKTHHIRNGQLFETLLSHDSFSFCFFSRERSYAHLLTYT